MESANPRATPDILRTLARNRALEERCELCGTPIGEEHSHLVEPAGHKLLCSCRACALLFSREAQTRYLLVPDLGRVLSGFQISDEQWASLLIPVDMAYFFHSTPMGRVVAFYPSPAGATESLLTLEAWGELVAANPVLGAMRPDVEGLLVSRVGSEHEYFIAPIDRFYELVGTIKVGWTGFSGGTEVWRAIREFFDRLRSHSTVVAKENR
jgi:hypothetical protein